MSLTMALLAPVFIMVMAMSVEVTAWSVGNLELQRIADAAAWAGAQQYGATTNAKTATYAAADIAEINGVAGATTRTWNATTLTTQDNLITAQIVNGVRNSANTALKVTVKRVIAKTFSQVFPSSSTSVTVTAVAVAELLPAPSCVVALSPSANNAIQVDNMGGIVASNCGITSNSSAANAIYLNSGTIKGTSVNAVGGISLSNSGSNTFSPAPGNSHSSAAANPYAASTAPQAGGCSYNNASFTAYQATPYAFTQAANVFCGNTTIGGNGSTDTFAPGIYYVVNGNLTFNNASVTSASGVSFVLTGSNPGAVSWTNYSNTATQITAPTTGATAGIVFWQNCPASGSAPANTMAGGSTLNLSGSFYSPCGALNLSNNIKLSAASGASMSVVASTIYATGSAAINAASAGSASSAASVALVQ